MCIEVSKQEHTIPLATSISSSSPSSSSSRHFLLAALSPPSEDLSGCLFGIFQELQNLKAKLSIHNTGDRLPWSMFFLWSPCSQAHQHQALCRWQPLLMFYWAVQWSCFARMNALSNLSCKKLQEVAALLPGRFLRRRCFTLCITTEAEPVIGQQYKCHHSCSC